MGNISNEIPTRVDVRYMVKNVDESVAFYTGYLGFTLLNNFAPAFADVALGNLRLLLSGPTSSAGRAMPDGTTPVPGGWNRFQIIVSDINAEVQKLKGKGLNFRNEIITGPGGSQILLMDPSGNFIELFEPARV
ncbi:VOC family protein [Mucilaginibacter calamicampi]|uniref:VOC family protein n=1 Tax=Mucilaginibacter calamicampi TaxID=1302352 RepID=A0ABW2YW26_9SPHI